MARRPKQADFVSLNLRLPPKLHKTLVKAAGSASSLNSEIVRRLQGSFDLAEKFSKMAAEAEQRVRETEQRLREERNEELDEIMKRLQAIEAHARGAISK